MKIFRLISKYVFEYNGIKYNRRFRVVMLNGTTARVSDVKTGSILGDFKLSEVRIIDQPLRNWNQLEEIVYNHFCVCDGGNEQIRGRIFDDTFGATFE